MITPEAAVAAIEAHLRRGFPINPDGARLRSPNDVDPGVLPPYFLSFSLPVLLDEGRGELAAEVWRTCWGWLLDQGATTWWEVFDDRWSQCHRWSGSPTWQLSR